MCNLVEGNSNELLIPSSRMLLRNQYRTKAYHTLCWEEMSLYMRCIPTCQANMVLMYVWTTKALLSREIQNWLKIWCLPIFKEQSNIQWSRENNQRIRSRHIPGHRLLYKEEPLQMMGECLSYWNRERSPISILHILCWIHSMKLQILWFICRSLKKNARG